MKRLATLAILPFLIVGCADYNSEPAPKVTKTPKFANVKDINIDWYKIQPPQWQEEVYTFCSPVQSGKRLYILNGENMFYVVDDEGCKQ